MSKLIVVVSLLLSCVAGILACGSNDQNKDTSTKDSVEWSQITPILTKSCSGPGSSCHSNTVANGDLNFENITSEQFIASKSLSRIQSDQDPMPPENLTENPDEIVLGKNDKLLLIRYLSGENQ